MSIIQAIAQTAVNALNAYGSAAKGPVVGHILAPIAAAAAVAAGMVQVATIRKQQQASEAQGYMQGGFTPQGRKDKPVGVVHAGEWVAPQEIVNSPATRPIINMLETARRSNRLGSIRYADVSRSATAQLAAARSADHPVVISRPEPAASNPDPELRESINRLNSRLNEPIVSITTVAGDHGIKKKLNEYDRLIRNKSPKP